jgi:Uma2 family endonuclease
MSTATMMTVEQFAQMRTADTEDYELVEGELVPLASGTPLHAKVRRRAERFLEEYFELSPIGDVFSEIDCRLDPVTVRRPDVSVFLGERINFELTRAPVPFPPDIAVEILSRSESAIEVNRKALEYLEAGTGEVWLFDNTNAEIFVQTASDIRLLRGNDVLESPLLPGFSHTVTELLVAA